MKIARCCGAKQIPKKKCAKHSSTKPPLEVKMLKKCMRMWRKSHLEVTCWKHHMLGPLLDLQVSFCVAGADRAPCQNGSQTWGFCSMSKKDGKRGGHLKRIWNDASRMVSAVRETCSSEMLGNRGADFLRWIAFWSIRSFGLLR